MEFLLICQTTSAGIGTHSANAALRVRLPGLRRAGPSTPLDEVYLLREKYSNRKPLRQRLAAELGSPS